MPGPRTYVDPSDISGVLAGGSTSDGALTASATQTQAAGTPITKAIVRFTTVASSGNAATLRAALAGDRVFITNRGANSMNIFPAVGELINALSANAAYALAAGKSAYFVSGLVGTWDVLLSA